MALNGFWFFREMKEKSKSEMTKEKPIQSKENGNFNYNTHNFSLLLSQVEYQSEFKLEIIN